MLMKSFRDRCALILTLAVLSLSVMEASAQAKHLGRLGTTQAGATVAFVSVSELFAQWWAELFGASGEVESLTQMANSNHPGGGHGRSKECDPDVENCDQ